MQLGDTSKALFTAILELNELNCSETLRFDLIQTPPTINNVLASFEKNFFNQGVISTDRKSIIELAMLLRCYFASIYLNIAQTSHEQLKSSFLCSLLNKRKIYKLQNSGDFPSIATTYQALYQQHMLYSEPVKGQWLIANQLYETAVQYKYHLTNINHIQGVQHPLAILRRLMRSLFLLIFLTPIRFASQKFRPCFNVVLTGHA
jgi:hypothetical protein